MIIHEYIKIHDKPYMTFKSLIHEIHTSWKFNTWRMSQHRTTSPINAWVPTRNIITRRRVTSAATRSRNLIRESLRSVITTSEQSTSFARLTASATWSAWSVSGSRSSSTTFLDTTRTWSSTTSNSDQTARSKWSVRTWRSISKWNRGRTWSFATSSSLYLPRLSNIRPRLPRPAVETSTIFTR